MPLSPGDRLGVYEITAEIGAGGMGIVYRARDTKLDQDVALKVLPQGRTRRASVSPSRARVRRVASDLLVPAKRLLMQPIVVTACCTTTSSRYGPTTCRCIRGLIRVSGDTRTSP